MQRAVQQQEVEWSGLFDKQLRDATATLAPGAVCHICPLQHATGGAGGAQQEPAAASGLRVDAPVFTPAVQHSFTPQHLAQRSAFASWHELFRDRVAAGLAIAAAAQRRLQAAVAGREESYYKYAAHPLAMLSAAWTKLFEALQVSTLQHSTAQHSTAQHSKLSSRGHYCTPSNCSRLAFSLCPQLSISPMPLVLSSPARPHPPV
jgi:hypothetical protein